MMLNKQKGNMYPWVTHTWNGIKGKCPHDCSYCYMKRYPQPELHFDTKALLTNLGSGNTIFVGSSCDMWAEKIPETWIQAVLWRCLEHQDNRYLFQSKNPIRFKEFRGLFPSEFMIGTTIETTWDWCNKGDKRITGGQPPWERKRIMTEYGLPKMVSIEPIMDFDLDVLVQWIKDIFPEFVSIGADSGNNHLPEPSGDKIKALIEALKEFTTVKIKDNLKRLLGATNALSGRG